MRSKPSWGTRFASRFAASRGERTPLTAGAVVAAVTVLALGACTAGGSSDGADRDGTAAPVGSGAVSAAAPGKYKTLPQPCTAVDLDSLKDMVPGAADYSGTEALTYDTDRLVGCTWSAKTVDGTTRTLTLHVVRVVSYDPGVSDEAEAEADFDNQATAASIPSATPSDGTSSSPSASSSSTDGTDAAGSPSGQPSTGSSSGTGGTAAAGSQGDDTTTAGGLTTPSATTGANGANTDDSADADLAPRRLSGVGNAAFIDDVTATRSGASTRTVTVVFRTANVLATVTYSQSQAGHTPPQNSPDLQKETQKVASELQHKVEG